MKEQFRGPSFLREEIKPGPLKGNEYGEGAFTVVANLEELPEGVRKKAPEGYVVKQYKDKRLHPKDILFTSEWEVLKDDSLFEMARKLQARQRRSAAYFGKELPAFVLPSQFIVGTDEDGFGHIYEIQRKINSEMVGFPEFLHMAHYFSSNHEREMVFEQLAERVRAVSNKLADVKEELRIFIRLAEQLPDSEKWFFDLAPGNIVFTKDGLRCIDTNYNISLSNAKPRASSREIEQIKETIAIFIQSLKDLLRRL